MPKEDRQQMALSKVLSYLLRHGAEAEGIPMRPDGYIRLDNLRGFPQLSGLTPEQLQRIVAGSSKKRFELTGDTDGMPMVRAVQGHSIPGVQIEMEEIKDAGAYPLVIHGTYLEALPAILATGLSRMSRQHIHMATGLPKEPSGAPISGMRASIQAVIEVDLQCALAAGIPFYRSANGVILTPGIGGILPPRFFRRVYDARTGQDIHQF